MDWNANPEVNIAGYKLHYGTASGSYDQVVDVGNVITLTISNLSHSTTYFFTLSAYNTAGLEGALSAEVILLPDNADLSSLTLSTVALTPGFASDTVTYTSSAPYATASLNVTPTLAHAAASVKVNGATVASGSASASITLNVGMNTITTIVTAQDAITTKTYTVAVTRLTTLETWRQTYFGSPVNAGAGADSATPQNDGVSNVMKFATAMNPTIRGAMPGAVAKTGNNLIFTYTRNKEALIAGLTFAVVRSDTMAAGSWISTGVVETFVDQGATERVTATMPAGTTGRRFAHLVVTIP